MGIPLVLLLAAVRIPFHAEGLDGERTVDLPGGVRIEVITAELSTDTLGLDFSYLVEGVRMRSPGFTDTLFWLADDPETVLAQALLTGAGSLAESRTIEILVLDESCIGGLLRVVTSRNGRDRSRFLAFRTWLWGGTLLDLESVVQVDDSFFAVLSDSLGLDRGTDVEDELWKEGFWLDPQSFLLIKGPDSPPLLRLGLPSTAGADTMLVVSMPFSNLHSASGAMLD
jgi:hypothetical protein